ncbi:SRPBCC family protein [Streptomyces chumphonensis]|uniref:SRPBCC family protein n=1 Tax=Streptomyces chumphonensis TaxID=1214925 RepID=UPI003D7050EC
MDHVAGESRHISVRIGRPAGEVYAYASDPSHLPAWAEGLGGSIAEVDGRWVAEDAPMGRVEVAFVPHNELGVLDHYVTLPTGEIVYNPLRVLADGAASEVVFTLRRQPGTSDADFQRDADMVAADLARLKALLESA